MSDEIDTLIARLRAYCLTKPGAYETISSGKEQPTYRVFKGSLNRFASFYLAEEPTALQLCWDHDLLKEMQERYGSHIAIFERIKWKVSGREWVEIKLSNSIPEADLYRFIDASYDLIFQSLDDNKKQLISLTEKPIVLQEALEALIEYYQLAHRHAEILGLVRPAIFIRTQKTDTAALQPAQSRLGGVPDLPSHWQWPMCDGRPQAFLAQFNLDEIPSNRESNELPTNGILYVFSALGWRDEQSFNLGWGRKNDPSISQILFFSGDLSSLKRADRPDGIPTYDSAAVEYLWTYSLPYAWRYARDPSVNGLRWVEDEYKRLEYLTYGFNYLARHSAGFPSEHQLLGYALPLQGTVTKPGVQLLFQLGCDYQTGMEWGDAGITYFVIPQDDLKKGDFSRVDTYLQSL
jgi:uncharacterized protein YwqG/predicted DNA-binding protein (MmcQ/YjbR family)